MPRPKKSSYGDRKPPFSYVALCSMAIHSSSTGMMTLNDIYRFITNNFPFYKNHSSKWRNSLRHNLSFNDCFVKIISMTQNGTKRSYWTLHPSCGNMFRDGSLLRRKKRFVTNEEQTESRFDEIKESELGKNLEEEHLNEVNCLQEIASCQQLPSPMTTGLNVTTDFTIENILRSSKKSRKETTSSCLSPRWPKIFSPVHITDSSLSVYKLSLLNCELSLKCNDHCKSPETHVKHPDCQSFCCRYSCEHNGKIF